jgi:polyhydroxyalkanoate synthesis regulator phasin
MGTSTGEAAKAMDALSNRLTAATNIGDVMFVDKISSLTNDATSYIQSKTEVLENRIQELEN